MPDRQVTLSRCDSSYNVHADGMCRWQREPEGLVCRYCTRPEPCPNSDGKPRCDCGASLNAYGNCIKCNRIARRCECAQDATSSEDTLKDSLTPSEGIPDPLRHAGDAIAPTRPTYPGAAGGAPSGEREEVLVDLRPWEARFIFDGDDCSGLDADNDSLTLTDADRALLMLAPEMAEAILALGNVVDFGTESEWMRRVQVVGDKLRAIGGDDA